MADAFIYDHLRSPRGRGKVDGSLHEVQTVNLAAQVLKGVRERNNRDVGPPGRKDWLQDQPDGNGGSDDETTR